MRAWRLLTMLAGLASARLDPAAVRANVTPKADAIVNTNIELAGFAVAPMLNFLALTRDGSVLYNRTAGPIQLGSLEPLKYDSLFWVASHGKILGMMALLKCVDQGLIGLNDNVLPFLPTLAEEEVLINPTDPDSATRARNGDITVFNLLTFTAGCDYPVIKFLAAIDPLNVLLGTDTFFPNNASVYAGPHFTDPNNIWRYGSEADYAGLLVESLTGKTLGEFVQENFMDPVGVPAEDFTYCPTDAQRARYVGSHVKPNSTVVVPRAQIYNDSNVEFDSAGSGTIANINAMAQALLPLINGGKHPKTGAQILSSETVAQMFQPQLTEEQVENGLNQPSAASNSGNEVLFPGVPKQWGLGALLFPDGFPQTGRGKNTLSWAGFTNVNWHCDIEKGVLILGWTSMIPSDDPGFNSLVRYPIEKLIYDAMGDEVF